MEENQTLVQGINFIADLQGALGLSEAARNVFRAIRQQQIPLSYTPFDYPVPRENAESVESYQGLPQGVQYALSLMFYNVNVFHTLTPNQLSVLTGDRYTIGYWFWELAQVPKAWSKQFERVNEIWVATHYVQQIMLGVANKPVHVIPMPVEVTTSPKPQRAHFGIPDNRYVFLFSFSALSSDARKNPWSFIAAFERAFGRNPGVDGPLLVIKTHHLHMFPSMQKELREKVAGVGGLLLEDDYTRQEVNDLFACADAYVSLHRGEGFGLGMAEAMYLGKPVIGTAYSGNLDFMRPDNSYLVDYTLQAISPADHRHYQGAADFYEPGFVWAEPNIDQAAANMHTLYEDPTEGRERGQRAASYIREHYSSRAAGRAIEMRLHDIDAHVDLSLFQRRNHAVNFWDYFNKTGQAAPSARRLRLAVSGWRAASKATSEWLSYLSQYFDIVFFVDMKATENAPEISDTSPYDVHLWVLEGNDPDFLSQRNYSAPLIALVSPEAIKALPVTQCENLMRSAATLIVYHDTDKQAVENDHDPKTVYTLSVLADESSALQIASQVTSIINEIAQTAIARHELAQVKPLSRVFYQFDGSAPGTGWRLSERMADGRSFQWMSRQESSLNFYLDVQANYKITVCLGAQTSTSVLNTFNLWVNAELVELTRLHKTQGLFSNELTDGHSVFEGHISAETLRKNPGNTAFLLNVAPPLIDPQTEISGTDPRSRGAQLIGWALNPETNLPARLAPANSPRAHFDLWNRRRVEAMTLQGQLPILGRLIQRLGKLPIIGTLLFTMKHALRMGTVWEAEMRLFQAILETQETIETELAKLKTEMRNGPHSEATPTALRRLTEANEALQSDMQQLEDRKSN